MDIFLALLIKLIPLYVIIFLGFIAGKYLQVRKESIATLVIYLVAPVVFFHGVYTTHISLSTLSSPLLVFGICCCVSLLLYGLGSLAFSFLPDWEYYFMKVRLDFLLLHGGNTLRETVLSN